ncbi:hypothetical protein BU25DRAFT_92488 [Macroventuria anomochaeta]|uniref:Uncharacterized protein n=1 Tax=Macroventuria anomochaeta TaxID=301207 RepID=A0ACB6RZT5_9PLEO|nr:uncharacterized protein BU25DRAFT_92488 [Macroventuria anomochaeta]KAF2626663.1 hypothetical protein BU25DRAFT_92488 [Macroventuria anomochaeta]
MSDTTPANHQRLKHRLHHTTAQTARQILGGDHSGAVGDGASGVVLRKAMIGYDGEIFIRSSDKMLVTVRTDVAVVLIGWFGGANVAGGRDGGLGGANCSLGYVRHCSFCCSFEGAYFEAWTGRGGYVFFHTTLISDVCLLTIAAQHVQNSRNLLSRRSI